MIQNFDNLEDLYYFILRDYIKKEGEVVSFRYKGNPFGQVRANIHKLGDHLDFVGFSNGHTIFFSPAYSLIVYYSRVKGSPIAYYSPYDLTFPDILNPVMSDFLKSIMYDHHPLSIPLWNMVILGAARQSGNKDVRQLLNYIKSQKEEREWKVYDRMTSATREEA